MGGGDGVRAAGGEERALITCSFPLNPSCQEGSGAKDTGTPGGEGILSKEGFVRSGARSVCLTGAQWPIRGPERTGNLPPLSGTLQEACSCREESMAPRPCFMPPAGCRMRRGVWRPLPALRAARPPPELCPPRGIVSSGARLVHEGRTPTLASPSGTLVPPPLAASRAALSSPRDTQDPITGRRGPATAPGVRWAAARSCLRGPGLRGSASARSWVVVPAAAAASGLPRAAPAAAKAGRHRDGRGPGERGGGGAGVRPAPSVPVHLLSLTKVRQTKVTGL